MNREMLYLSRSAVEEVGLGMGDIIEGLDLMFKEKGVGRVEMPPKPGIHTRPDAFIHAMPAYIPKLEAAGVKWIAGYPDNQKKALPYINGLLILNDPETGIPLALMDATWITAQRTGAATALAAKYLAHPDSSSAGILACGVQGFSNLEALLEVFDIKEVRAYDLYPEQVTSFAEKVNARFGIGVTAVEQAKDAVVDMDLVVTSGPILKDPTPTIERDWLKAGAFASPVDFDSYWQPGALQQADKIITDDIAQFEYYKKLGYFKDTPSPHCELGDIAAGKLQGRKNENERVICINLGIALEDMATAISIYQKAVENGLGTPLPL